MQTGMSRSIRWQIMTQVPKITVLWAAGGVRPYIEISRIFSKICSHLHVWLLSKNALLSKNPLKTALFIHVDQSLPAT